MVNKKKDEIEVDPDLVGMDPETIRMEMAERAKAARMLPKIPTPKKEVPKELTNIERLRKELADEEAKEAEVDFVKNAPARLGACEESIEELVAYSRKLADQINLLMQKK